MPDNHNHRSMQILGATDERTDAIAFQADAYAGRFLSLVVLVYSAYRLIRYTDASGWGWFIIAMIAGAISTIYRVKHQVHHEQRYIIVIIIVGILVALAAFILSYFSFLGTHNRTINW